MNLKELKQKLRKLVSKHEHCEKMGYASVYQWKKDHKEEAE